VREALDDAERTHLRSAKELIGYKVEASDGDAGELDDFAIDDEDWSIPYLIVDAKPWWPGGQVLVRPANIEAIHFDRSRVTVNLTKQALRDAGQG
ncbi:MAG: PRC-barrel domain-containing protein, partial [Rhizobacter sp.]